MMRGLQKIYPCLLFLGHLSDETMCFMSSLSRYHSASQLQMSDAKPEINSVNAAERFFQLEEREDSETCETEVYLRWDQGVDVLHTDGPQFSQASGSWSQRPDGTLEIILSRTYDSGTEQSGDTDMGEFQYTVERIFSGEMTYAGESIAVTGPIVVQDEFLGEQEVGYFNLLDTTSDRKSAG